MMDLLDQILTKYGFILTNYPGTVTITDTNSLLNDNVVIGMPKGNGGWTVGELRDSLAQELIKKGYVI